MVYKVNLRYCNPHPILSCSLIRVMSIVWVWGVVDQDWTGGVAYFHSGSNSMNAATVWIVPELDEAYLMVSNSAENETWVVLDELVGFWIGYDSQ